MTTIRSIMDEKEKEKEKIEFERELRKKSDALELSCLETSIDDDATPCDSSLTTDDSVLAHRLKLMDAAATRCREIQLKVARRARSKVIYRSSKSQNLGPKICENPNPKKAAKSETTITTTTTTTERSCLSSGGSSEISSAGSGLSRRKSREEGERKRRGVGVNQIQGDEMKRRSGVGSKHIRLRAEAIMSLLSGGGCASEVRIRQILGDSPDTSKALRLLLKMEEVKRTGLGGRTDPFIYKIATGTEA
ncbi:hypothetical protein Cgig2_025886 [Carnegiea gigantea]|uniref:HTH three-helical bundle domain-containing protein n=1 Tax=Carnegiea gigantea TaxID=171969 RepID=A0A9Q1QCU7_9CARY|nr:hypothetical protein Cgig2_025886 [Carnegiea gigantea]